MTIKARPFKTKIGEVEVEGFFEDESFTFRFYGLVTFRPLVISVEEDERGKFAVLQETEIPHPDGFVFTVETNYDSDLGCEWGYSVSLKRNDIGERNVIEEILKRKGVDPESVILVTPPKQLTSVYFDPNGLMDGSAQLQTVESGGSTEDIEASLVLERVQASGALRVLFLTTRSQTNVAT